jgi:glycosyltransferase involved in cell wall biosynthesis
MPPPLKVLIVHNAGRPSLPSGESVVVERDAEALRWLGVEVVSHVIPVEEPVGLLQKLRAAGDLLWSRGAYKDLTRLIERHRPSVVHAHSVLPRLSAAALHAARRMGVPAVQTLHNHRWICVEGALLRDGQFCNSCVRGHRLDGVRHRCARGSRPVSLALAANNIAHVATGSLHSAVSRYVAVSNYVRDRHIEGGFPAERISVKYNSVDVDEDASTAYEPRSVCFVGRLDNGKGVDLLIDAAAHLRDHRFELIGVGPMKQVLVEAMKEHRGGVSLSGRLTRPEITQRLVKSAVVLVPSRASESFGLAAAEAMACGVPVVATTRGALPELIGASGGGLTAPPRGEELAEAVRRITSSPSLRLALGRAGRSFAESELTLQRSAERLLAIYRQVLE